MNYYYILPKNNTPLKLFFSFNENELDPTPGFISHTLIYSLFYIKKHIQNYNHHHHIQTQFFDNYFLCLWGRC